MFAVRRWQSKEGQHRGSGLVVRSAALGAGDGGHSHVHRQRRPRDQRVGQAQTQTVGRKGGHLHAVEGRRRLCLPALVHRPRGGVGAVRVRVEEGCVELLEDDALLEEVDGVGQSRQRGEGEVGHAAGGLHRTWRR